MGRGKQTRKTETADFTGVAAGAGNLQTCRAADSLKSARRRKAETYTSYNPSPNHEAPDREGKSTLTDKQTHPHAQKERITPEGKRKHGSSGGR